ncbi:MAG TPA: DUF2332 domain-containing protein [Streptosporangiaceae bacterium]
MSGHDPGAGIAENYREFGLDARGRSAHYEELAAAVAGDQMVIEFLTGLPVPKRQPNLLFAAAWYLLGQPPGLASLRELVAGHAAELTAVMLARRTQTNEPARCATLLPALAALPEPLALIEVGASAGLTLLPDRYCYDFGGQRVPGTDPRAPVLRCEPRGPVPVPARVPRVAWRAGLDLSPLDVNDGDDMRWLGCLLWPGESDREQRLAAAIATARRDPPPVYRGDLLTDLAALAAKAPPGATLVIYHSAVLAYVAKPQRRQFAAAVRDLGAAWLSNEAPLVLPDVPAPADPDRAFLLVRDGRVPVAWTDPHGTWVRWLS